MNQILQRVFILGQFINDPVQNIDKAAFYKKLSLDGGQSLCNYTNHCPDCFD